MCEHRPRSAGRVGAAFAAAALLSGCHPGEAGPIPTSVQPREFRIIIHTDGDMTDAIVDKRGGDVFGSDDHKRDLVEPYVASLLEQVNAIYLRSLGVRFYLHPAERDWIDTTVSPFGECGHRSAALWNNALIEAMDSPPDLATMLEHCDRHRTNASGYSHWNGLCSGGFAESVVATGRDVDAAAVPLMVAHELGHLMGASHTFDIPHNYTNGDRHYEPGCGSTLMSYGGGMVDPDACTPANDFVDLTDDYFHAYSIGEMQREIAEEIRRGACGRLTHPEIDAPPPALTIETPDGAVVPAWTPFVMRASFAPDPEDGGVVSFDVSFDEIDDDGGGSSLGEDTGHNSIVRSRLHRDLPAVGGTIARAVPLAANVAAGVRRPEESPATRTRDLHFRVMARALHAYGATTAAADLHLRVLDTGSGFGALDHPAEVVAGESFTLTWDPAGTAAESAFDAAEVRFRLCTSGCTRPEDFTITLTDGAGGTLFPNTGSASARVPRSSMTAGVSGARLWIENRAGTFFDVGRKTLAIAVP